ncbi:MAG: hypothetical protein ACYDDE_08590 [bacterium]
MREFIVSPVGCHSCESRNPVLLIIDSFHGRIKGNIYCIIEL